MVETRYIVTTKGSLTIVRRAPGSPTYPLAKGVSARRDDAGSRSTRKASRRPTRKKKTKRRG